MLVAGVLLSDSWFELSVMTLFGILLISVGIHTFRDRRNHPVARTLVIIVAGMFSLLLYMT